MHELIVLSDLHIGRGRNDHTGRYHSLETFFYDEDLRRFLRQVCADVTGRGGRVRVVFNGDAFDLLRTEPELPAEGWATGRERRFGAQMTPATAACVMADILRGHPVFVDALAEVLAAGQEIVFLPGNHDIEIQWAPVQEQIRSAVSARLAGRLGTELSRAAMANLRFEPWFHYEPGRIWIEHGCQYDAECAFRYPLRGGMVDVPESIGEADLDLPLGNFFQRYLYNAFGALTFIVPSTRANARYTKWLLFNKPGLLFRVLGSHVPFVVEVTRRLAKKAANPKRVLKRIHNEELERLAEESGLGDTLFEIDGLKQFREDVLQTVMGLGRQLLRGTLITALLAGLAVWLWFSGFVAINELRAGFGLKALLFLAMNTLPLVGAAAGLGYMLSRSSPAVPQRPLKTGAQKLVDLLDVPLVTFGHTHEETVWPLRRRDGSPAWYFNSGTWIAVFTHDVLLPRERVQLTYLHVKGHEAELLHWSPGRGESLPVILLDEERHDGALAPAPAAVPAG